MIRVLNKYRQENIDLNVISKFIKSSVENLRSGISKNALVFLTEFFGSVRKKESLADFVAKILPSIMVKTGADKVFISKEAKNAMVNLVGSCHFGRTLDVLLNFA